MRVAADLIDQRMNESGENRLRRPKRVNEGSINLHPPTDVINTTGNILALLEEAKEQMKYTQKYLREMGMRRTISTLSKVYRDVDMASGIVDRIMDELMEY